MTTTTTETKPEVEVAPGVLNAVKDFIKTKTKTDEIITKAKASLESKYWPLVEQALLLFENKLERTDIEGQFIAAFKLAHGNAETASRHISTWRLMASKVTKIAFQGRGWVEEQKGAGLGFWAVLDLIQNPASTAAPEEDPPSSKARGSKAKAKPTKSTHKKSGNVKVSGGTADGDSDDGYDFDKVMEFIEASPRRLVGIVNAVLENQMVSFDDLVEIHNKISTYIKENK